MIQPIYPKQDGQYNMIAGLAMALLAVTSWEEPHRKEPGKMFRRSNKQYPIDILDELERRGLIRTTINSRAVHVTEAGEKIGDKLLDAWRDAFIRFIAEGE